jgi:hypothetical protein
VVVSQQCHHQIAFSRPKIRQCRYGRLPRCLVRRRFHLCTAVEESDKEATRLNSWQYILKDRCAGHSRIRILFNKCGEYVMNTRQLHDSLVSRSSQLFLLDQMQDSEIDRYCSPVPVSTLCNYSYAPLWFPATSSKASLTWSPPTSLHNTSPSVWTTRPFLCIQAVVNVCTFYGRRTTRQDVY